MMRSLLLFLTLVIAGTAAHANPDTIIRTEGLRLELAIAETTVLQHGVLVGQVTFYNDVEADVALVTHASASTIDIEKPDGTIVSVNVEHETIAGESFLVAMGPMAAVTHPLCLIASRGSFVFDTPGQYQLRYRYRLGNREPAVASDWVSVVVKPAGVGLDVWRQAVGELDIDSAFALSEGPERWRQQLHRFLDYRHEMVKLILYQYEGPRIRRVLQGTRPSGGEEEVAAEIMLAMAQAAGIGEAMWEWIQAALTGSAHRSGGSGKTVTIRDGYFF